MKYKRTILFTNQDNTDRYCVIDEEINSKLYRPRFEIKEYVFGIKVNRFNRFGIMDENQEIIALEEYRKRKIENGYIEIPNDEYGYDELIGVFKKNGITVNIRKYLEITNEFVPIDIPNTPFGRKIFEYLITNQKSVKEKLIEKLYSEFSDLKESVKDLWDEEDIKSIFPDLKKKEEILKMVDFRRIGISSEESFNHEASDKSKFCIIGECFWDEGHGFEIYFDENYELQNL